MTDDIRILGAPRRYMQGQGAIGQLGRVVAEFGQAGFVVADAVVTDLIGDEVAGILEGAGIRMVPGLFGGECTLAEIDRQAAFARQSGCDVIVGMGGGKAIDTAKGVSLELGQPIVIVPTIASNDSPTSRLVIVYDGEHRLAEVLKLPHNPDVVLVDTAIIAAAPSRFLVAGIGDALAKKFEAEQAARTGGRNFFGGLPTHTALMLCDHCYAVVRQYGADAVAAVKRGRLDDSLERTVEATILLSGIGFESGGLALAHSLTRGLTAQPDAARALHGEMVAWGLLVQLIAEGRRPAFIDEIAAFYRQIGLPLGLTDLGIRSPGRRIIAEIAGITCRDAPYVTNMVAALSAERLAFCIRELEERFRP